MTTESFVPLLVSAASTTQSSLISTPITVSAAVFAPTSSASFVTVTCNSSRPLPKSASAVLTRQSSSLIACLSRSNWSAAHFAFDVVVQFHTDAEPYRFVFEKAVIAFAVVHLQRERLVCKYGFKTLWWLTVDSLLRTSHGSDSRILTWEIGA